MVRGTTPTHTFLTDVDLTDAEALYVTYKQNGRILVEKALEDVSISEDMVTVRLTQAETLRFSPIGRVRMQIRARFADGTAIACSVIEADVNEILKDGEI